MESLGGSAISMSLSPAVEVVVVVPAPKNAMILKPFAGVQSEVEGNTVVVVKRKGRLCLNHNEANAKGWESRRIWKFLMPVRLEAAVEAITLDLFVST
jgi:hypothetical protein